MSLTALISLMVAVPLVVYILVLRWRADARYDAVTALLPSAHVVEGIACDPTTAGFFGIGGANASTQAKRGFAVAFDEEGAGFYEGGRHVVEFLRLEWAEVESIDLATVTVNSNRQATALELTVAHDDESTKLPIVIKSTQGVTGFRFSSPFETNEHFKAIRSLRGASPAAPRPVVGLEAPAGEEKTARRRLAPGMSSVGMSRFAGIAVLFGLIAFLAMLPFGILTWTHFWAAPGMFFLPFLLIGLVAIAVGRIVGVFIPMRESAELRAGYTLSREGDINVDQLDPKTGYVIRVAGHQTLSREQEKSEILRARARESSRRRISTSFARWAVAICVILAIGLGSAYIVGTALWWNTTTTAVCTLVDYHYRDSPGGVVYDVDTDNCGPLQVTSGPILTPDQATKLGDSLRAGEKYKLVLRGWSEWPNSPRAIVAASDLMATKTGLNP
ncbi:phage holin family protein [Diaminobutyricibacter sp. McL0618]|uniref:phage holin family protein n=1 Tax=Leifsonia sp. McL0618 TaxID=3415677 RepID=UPI003CE8AD51